MLLHNLPEDMYTVKKYNASPFMRRNHPKYKQSALTAPVMHKLLFCFGTERKTFYPWKKNAGEGLVLCIDRTFIENCRVSCDLWIRAFEKLDEGFFGILPMFLLEYDGGCHEVSYW